MATSTRKQPYTGHQSNGLSVGLLKRPFNSILNKIVLPFLLLTLLVAVSGTFIVTRVLAANVQDRLTNQLIDTARAASDRIVLVEQQQLDSLRLAVFTRGVPEALRDGDETTLERTMTALAGNQDLFTLIATDVDGNVVAGIRSDNGSYITGWLVGQNLTITPIIQSATQQEQDELGDKFAGILIIDEQIVLLTVAPVYDQSGVFVGTMSVGVPLPEVLSSTKQEILADITFYQSDGSPLETTFVLPEAGIANGQNTDDTQNDQHDLAIAREQYLRTISASNDQIALDEIVVNGRTYQTAYVPLRVRQNDLGVLGVSLPSTIVTTLITTNRNGLSIVFALISGLTVIVGYIIARGLTNPIQRLAATAEEVSGGNLQIRSGVRTSDEIGLLGRTFDAMTERLNEQNQALEEAYRKQEQETAFLTAVLSSAADGIVVIAPEGEIVRVNPVAMDLFRSDETLWTDALTTLVNSVLNGETDRLRVNMQNQWFDALASKIVGADNQKMIGVVIALRDVTDQVLTEHMRTAFIMQISHELRTPLTVAKGFNDLALQMLADTESKIKGFLEHVAEQLAVLITLINQILDVAQLVRGELQLETDTFDLSVVLTDLVNEHHDEIESKSIKLKVDIEQLPRCQGDRERIKWGLDQLLKNAINYTPVSAENEIELSAHFRDSSIVLQVRDTGVGISRRDLPRIFEQFYRGFPITTDGKLIDVRGAGLGLFILDRVVQAHHGQVEAESQIGVGSTFTVYLPVALTE